MRKLFCLCLALLLALSLTSALAESDLQSQLDAANARVAELEAQVEKYYPYYHAQLAATFGEDGVVWVRDIMEQFDAVKMQYQSMGISIEQLGAEVVAGTMRDLVASAVQTEIKLMKGAELGLDQFTDEQKAEQKAYAEQQFADYVDYYISYFYPEQEVTDEMRAEAEHYWEHNGMSIDEMMAMNMESAVISAVDNYLSSGIEITDDEIKAYYDAKVEENKADYANDRTYNSDRNAGAAIVWNPEGYRAVKHVLIQFDEEQNSKYTLLQQQLDELNFEKQAEPTEESTPRDAAEIDKDIEAVNAQIDELYAELMPTANEVVAAFEGGADFNDLIAKYGQDPGMTNEPTASQGYAVTENSMAYDGAFASAAMSIPTIGGISQPTPGSYGIYIVWYMSDITPGAVPFEQVSEAIAAEALNAKIEETRVQRLDAWIESANVEYHYENLGI